MGGSTPPLSNLFFVPNIFNLTHGYFSSIPSAEYLMKVYYSSSTHFLITGRMHMAVEAYIETLKSIVGAANVLNAKEDLVTYSYDATTMWHHRPDVVVFPAGTAQISQILKMANDQHIPVTARGGGTNLSGGSIPIRGGIVLCTTKMNRIISIKKETLTAEVEAGVILQDFSQALSKVGLFYPPDPQSAQGCTMGGTLAENASGPQGVKYGVTKQYLLGLEVILANGEIAHLGGQTIKNRMGYELATLFAGSEGMLGIISRMTVRLLPLPENQQTLLAVFNDIETAGETVSQIIASGVIPAKIEFVNNWLIRRIEEMTHLGLPVEEEALLLIQCDGKKESVSEEIHKIQAVCLKMGAKEARPARDEQEAARLWQARKSAFGAVYSSAPTVLGEDLTVPRDRIAPLIRKFKEIGKKYGFEIPITGHAGDGNLHPNLLTDVNNKENFALAMKAAEEMVKATIDMGGVLSGEHGIGLEKQAFIKMAMDPVTLRMMKDIKHLFDPNNILNPGKYWEE
jgi:glycolate oxidase